MENLELPAMGIYALLFNKLLEPPLKHAGYYIRVWVCKCFSHK